MIPPSFILAVLMGSMIGLAFFYAFGRKAENMFVCWAVAVTGFLVGNLLGAVSPVAPVLVGDVHLVEGTVASLITLVVIHFGRR